MTILKAGSGFVKLIFLPMLFCSPYPCYFAHHFYLNYTIIYKCYDALRPIAAHKAIWLYYSTNFLPPQTYLLMLQTRNSRFQNYKLLIQNLRTFDIKHTNYQSFLLQTTTDSKITNYQSFLLQTPYSNITNYQSFLLALTRSKDRRWCWEKREDSLSLNCR